MIPFNTEWRRIQFAAPIIAVAMLLALILPAHAADQKWVRVSSDHFIVLTDAGRNSGHEIAARFEQMRAVFGQLLMRDKIRMAEPLEIIAVANTADYDKISPLLNGDPITAPGFYLAGEDRVYIVLDASAPDSWRAVEHQFAHYLLDWNYPPTQPWFDEGFAEYFASLYFTPQKTQLGSDPELPWPNQASAGAASQASGSGASAGLKSLTEILNSPVWLNLTDLLEMKNRVVNGQEGTHHTLFYAQSWMLVDYLLNKNKLPETGAYFGLVENQGVPVAQAVQQAFGMSAAQLDRAVKDYFHSLKPLQANLDESKQANPPLTPEPVSELPLPFSLEDVGTSSMDVPLREAQALVDEMELRIPERREQAVQDLQKLIANPQTETAIAHRALAWALVQKGEIQDAFSQLTTALQINSSDPWARFDVALAAYRSGENGARIQGLANMMESLHIVIADYPDFAEAYNLLGWARLAGGGASAAIEAMKMAVQLSPRSEDYRLRLAGAYLAAKKFDDGKALLQWLASSQNPEIAQSAKKDLNNLPFLEKYGVEPQGQSSSANTTTYESASSDSDDADSDQSAVKPAAAEPPMDKGAVTFLKGTLISVDCAKSPEAVVTFSHNGKLLKFLVADYQSLPVIGAKAFSCKWKNIPVNINYRRGGKLNGDLVSIEPL